MKKKLKKDDYEFVTWQDAADPERWVQCTTDRYLNIAYPFSKEPKEEFSRHGIHVPEGCDEGEWFSEESVMYFCSGAEAKEIALFIEQIFTKLLGAPIDFELATIR